MDSDLLTKPWGKAPDHPDLSFDTSWCGRTCCRLAGPHDDEVA
jgi:hypothetical protein